MPRSARAIAIAVAALALGPAAAQAVTVGTIEEVHTGLYVQVDGTPERDVVAVTNDASGWAVAADALGTSPSSGLPCTPTAPLAVQCPIEAFSLFVWLGAGDDELQIAPGGGGGSIGRVVLDGGPGDDVIRGGDEPDQLPLTEGHDTLDGGGGIDTLVPVGGAEPVDIDLGGGTATQGDRSATVTNVENVAGMWASGTITGDGGPNTLQLGSGTLAGGAGDDVLTGGVPSGTAGTGGTLFGGAGDDTLRAGPGWNADCGAGRDDVVLRGPSTRLTADCETVTTDKGPAVVQVDARPSVRGRGVRTAVRCVAVPPTGSAAGRCKGRISAPVLGHSASAPYSLRLGERRTLTLEAATRPRSGRRVTVAVSVVLRDHSSVRRWSIPLR